jgi:hypothetical protein
MNPAPCTVTLVPLAPTDGDTDDTTGKAGATVGTAVGEEDGDPVGAGGASAGLAVDGTVAGFWLLLLPAW